MQVLSVTCFENIIYNLIAFYVKDILGKLTKDRELPFNLVSDKV